MKMQVNSDKAVTVDAKFTASVEQELNRILERFESQITRVEVHLSDVNSAKPGVRDKRCQIEVRSAGKKPVSVDFAAGTVPDAVRGATGKMKRLLENTFGRTAAMGSRKLAGTDKRNLDSSAALRRLDSIEASLAELADGLRESRQSSAQIRAAAQAVQRARDFLAGSREKPAGRTETRASGVRSASKSGPAVKGANTPAKTASVDGRSPKRKGVYRARRKSWPKR